MRNLIRSARFWAPLFVIFMSIFFGIYTHELLGPTLMIIVVLAIVLIFGLWKPRAENEDVQ